MALAPGRAEIFASTKALTGSPDVAGFKDNCTCSQNHTETSRLVNDSALRDVLASFDPQEIKTISDFVRQSDSAKQHQATET